MSEICSESDISKFLFNRREPFEGLLGLVVAEDDNEYVFQLLINVAMHGVRIFDATLPILLQEPETLQMFNEFFQRCGFSMKLRSHTEPIPYYCKVSDNYTTFLINRYHPFVLLKLAESSEKTKGKMPPIYEQFFKERQYLPNVIGLSIDNVEISFIPLNYLV